MDYHILCFLPLNRHIFYQKSVNGFMLSEDSSRLDTEENVHNISQKIVLNQPIQNLQPTKISLEILGNTFNFVYTSKLIFASERDCRSMPLVMYDSTELCNSSSEDGLAEKLNCGFIYEDLSIEFCDDSIGYGLFINSDNNVSSGTFLGEYTGVVKKCQSPSFSNYSHSYPCCDNGFEIDAKEYGNVFRFVNHSNNPNAEFAFVIHEGILHVLCKSLCVLKPGEQITVNYGKSFWEQRSIVPRDNS